MTRSSNSSSGSATKVKLTAKPTVLISSTAMRRDPCRVLVNIHAYKYTL